MRQFALACLVAPVLIAAAPVQLTTEEDHARTMALLGIEALRQGADGSDPDAPNAANYDEAKATPYPDLPDPLSMQDGRPVMSAAMWRQERRPELLELFSREIYGYAPANTPAVTWEIVEESEGRAGAIPVIITKLLGRADNSADPEIEVAIELTLVTPQDAAEAPVIMELYFGGFPGRPAPAFPPEHAEQILSRGWAYAAIIPNSIQADNGAGLTSGIIGLANHGQPRDADDWGALRAWAWGASRALDYFEADPRTDGARAAIAGLSRYGKAVAVAMAYDERWAVGLVGSSGAGGLKLHRRNFGELVENLAASSEYHWMAGNYLKYAGPLTWDDLPVDAHQLLALAAPRPVFISAGAPDVEGGWIDQRGMFLAGVGAAPVYELLGASGMGMDQWPAVGEGLLDGDIAYRIHEGGHTLGPNWPYMLDFAARYFEAPVRAD
jgi:hypothetical protein